MAVDLQNTQDFGGFSAAAGRIAVFAIATAGGLGLLILFPLPHWLVREYGPVELLQAAAWWSSAAIALLSAAAGRQGVRGRAVLTWLGVLSALAFCREFDMHVSLNPETLGDWGVRYRSDWWLDPDVSLGLKALWAGAGATVMLLVTVPLLIARPNPFRQLFVGHTTTVLLGLGVASMGAGYAMDDLFGRNQFIPWTMTEGIEESFELVGAVLWLVGVACATRSPMLVSRSGNVPG